MAITLRAAGAAVTNTVAAATLSLPYPAGVTSSDVMVLFASVNSGSVNGASLPAGWTQVFRTSNTAGTLPPHLMVAIKQAAGTETGNLAVTTASAKSTGQIIAFTGVNLTTPQDVAATSVDQTSAAVATLDIPTLTTTRPGCALVYVGAHNNGAETATAPSSPAAFTETGDNSGTGGWAGTMGYLIWASSGATGTVQVTFSGSNRGIGVLLALRALDQAGAAPLITATGSTASVAAATRPGSGDRTATGAAASAATVNRAASGDASATGSADAAAAATRPVSGDLAGTGTIAADAGKSTTATANRTGSAPTTSDATVSAFADGDRTGTGTRAAAATIARGADAALAGTGTLTAAATVARSATAFVTATGTLDADATVTPGNRLKLWDGAAWTAAPVKVWDGAAWTTAPTKHYDGATWTI